jgi:hypothetical protein
VPSSNTREVEVLDGKLLTRGFCALEDSHMDQNPLSCDMNVGLPCDSGYCTLADECVLGDAQLQAVSRGLDAAVMEEIKERMPRVVVSSAGNHKIVDLNPEDGASSKFACRGYFAMELGCQPDFCHDSLINPFHGCMPCDS